MPSPLRGEIWMIDLDPTRGHEQAGRRPALIVSADIFNAGPAGLVIVLPLTSKSKGVRSHVAVEPPEGGLRQSSFIKCEDMRSVAIERLGKRLGAVSPSTLDAVAMRLRVLMEL
ncbi:MAG: type II toxin-antitoxin system PemK/MazF family toxin [Pirellulales bacterium]|nr:type II toxin-antitoxin system PemK/MazF family toxin [Pirellulales bacterium]